MAALTRGPLPPSVYWRRRLIIIAVAAVLVVTLAQVLGGGGDGDDGAARPAAAEPSQDASPTTTPSAEQSGDAPSDQASAETSASPTAEPTPTESTALPEPEGTCDPADVLVEPVVEDAPAYDGVTVQLRVRTAETPACTWTMNAKAVQIRMVKGQRRLWASMECPGAVPREELTVYRDAMTLVDMTWNGRRSDADLCGRHADWAAPGKYRIAATALGGKPARSTFTLLAPGEKPSDETSPESPNSTEPTNGTQGPSGTRSSPGEGESAPSEGPEAGRPGDEPTALPE